MSLKITLLNVIIGALLLSFAVQLGVVSPSQSFLSNFVASVVIFLVTRVFSHILGR